MHLVVREKGIGRENKTTQHLQNKSLQSTEWRKREAWSAELADLRTKPTQWKFNRRHYRNKPSSTPGDLRQDLAEANDYKYNDARQSMRMRDGPNVIYTKEMQLQEAFANKHKEYIEDLENGYDRIATLHYHRRDQDNDSMRRHEIDRGSDVFLKSDVDKNDIEKDKLKPDQHEKSRAPSSHGRDQFFIKEGNTEILRLVTRGKHDEERYVNLPIHQQRPVTLIPHTQYVVVDSGKDLLMERFIREQGEEAKHIRDKMSKVQVTDLDNMSNDKDAKSYGRRSQVGSDIANQYLHEYSNIPDVPGTVPLKTEHLQSALLQMQNKSTLNQELLESSLRKQNELLHQILMERERYLQNQETASQVESKLETQSLPGQSVIATQTECHIGTQTEPEILKPTRRKARSDNDSYSEDESEMVVEDKKVAWVKKKKPKKKLKYKDPRRSIRIYELKRKIKTPIIEESEISPSASAESEKHIKVRKTNEREEYVRNYGDLKKCTVKTSKNETVSSTQIKATDVERKSGLRREVLMEISDSFESEVHERRPRLHRQNSLYQNDVDPNEVLDKAVLSGENRTDLRSRGSSAQSKDSRNLVFSRQGSSTEAREAALEMTPVKSIENQEIQKDATSNTDSSSKKAESKSDSTKPAQKSLPRYMQWYSRKGAASITKPPTSDKPIPSKPKRSSKLKTDDKIVADKEKARYGKIINKDENIEIKKNSKGKDEFIHPRLLKEEKVTPIPEGPLPDVHPLLQHSEHRYEHQYENQNPLCYVQPTHIPKYLGGQLVPALPRRQSLEQQPIYVNQDDVKGQDSKIAEGALTHSIAISTSYDDQPKPTEVHVSKINIGGDDAPSRSIMSKIDDNDSGIAMNTLVQPSGNIKRVPITEKKSIFTIAYDDVQTKQLRPDSSSTSY